MSTATPPLPPTTAGLTALAPASRPAWTPYLLVAPALALFAAILIIPLLMTALLSFHDWGQYKGIERVLILKNWREVLTDGYFFEVFLRTFRIAALVTLLAVLLGTPEAYILNRMRSPWRAIFLVVVLGPLLISVVARTLGWALLFGGNTGVVNQALMKLGVISEPVSFMFTELGVVVALTHVLLPYMILSVWAALQRLDPQVENAAASLGASQLKILTRVVLPQIVPGILAGGIIVFALAASAFATPAIIGGRRLKMASTLAYDEFLNTLNWPLGATVAVLLLAALILAIWGSDRLVERRYAEVFR
jgi:putative spermidine/putrescine transport system permease protein